MLAIIRAIFQKSHFRNKMFAAVSFELWNLAVLDKTMHHKENVQKLCDLSYDVVSKTVQIVRFQKQFMRPTPVRLF